VDSEDLEKRRPVWLALSEFWLDTELLDDDLKRIASVLASSPYSIPELREIERFEVAPVLWGNLVQTAGEWAGWDPDGLFVECAKRARLERTLLRRIRTALGRPFVRFHTQRHWQRLDTLIPAVRNERSGRWVTDQSGDMGNTLFRALLPRASSIFRVRSSIWPSRRGPN